MAISKITKPSTPIEEVDKINELVDGVNNAGTVKKVNNTSPDSNGNVTLNIPAEQVQANWNETNTSSKAYIQNKPTIPAGVVVDQTYNASSANAQSGVAIAGAGFLQNTATGSNALTIGGTAATTGGATNIGFASTAGSVGTAVGYNTAANGSRSTSIGYNARIGAAVSDAIQIGSGTNPTARTLCVGFYNYGNYPMLDGTTGKIPTDRIKYDGTTITVNSNGELTSTGGGGSTRNIGEIVSSTVPLVDAGLHLLDGALIQGSGIYSAFVTYIAGLRTQYSNLFTTESAWQSAVTQYGVCGKFVYNSTNNTVRLPKITGIIEGTTDVTALGDLVQAGLPDHDHTVTEHYLHNTSNGLNWGSGQTQGTHSITTSNASESNSIYGNSDTVQPQTIKVLYYIVIATSSKTEIEVDIDEIATDLNGKADVDLTNTNPSSSFATLLNTAGIRTVVETYVNGTSWYRIYSDGWCVQGGVSPSAGDKTNNTIMLLRSYKDTNYSILYAQNAGVENAYTNGCTAKNKTTSSFVLVYRTGGVASFYWQACGYIR